MKTLEKTDITVGTTVKLPVDVVWKCWTDPDHIRQWFHVASDWHAPYAENDLQVNGKFKTTMAARDGTISLDFEGVYKAIEEHQLIEFVIVDGRNVKVEFYDLGDETEVIETFDTTDVHPLEMQRWSWQIMLNSFKKYTEEHIKHIPVKAEHPNNEIE